MFIIRKHPYTRRAALVACSLAAFFTAEPKSHAQSDSLIRQFQSAARTMSDLRPTDNGPGIIVCPPATSPGLENFGKGMAAWVNLTVGGDPLLSKTPSLDDQARAAHEMHVPGFALSLEQADQLPRITGADTVVLGSLTGSKTHCKLQYQVYAVPSNRGDGDPIVMEGSEEQIAAGLPKIAAAIFGALEIKATGLPAATGLNAADLSFLGSIKPDTEWENLPRAGQARLRTLGRRSLLAAVIWHDTLAQKAQVQPVDSLIAAMAPANALAMAQVCAREGCAAPFTGLAARNARRVPDCYLYNTAAAWAYGQKKELALARAAAESGVCCAFRNPRAWLTLASMIDDECAAVREGKYFDDMTPAEQAYVDGEYPEWAVCCKLATTIDPKYGLAWLRLSTSACFAGDMAMADEAYWKATALYPSEKTYWWGLEMYQPKWIGDESRLAKVVVIATEGKYRSRAEAEVIAKQLDKLQYLDNAARLRRRYARHR